MTEEKQMMKPCRSAWYLRGCQDCDHTKEHEIDDTCNCACSNCEPIQQQNTTEVK
jgi:hypothetical protein